MRPAPVPPIPGPAASGRVSTDTGPLRFSHALHASRPLAAAPRRSGPVHSRSQLRLVPPAGTSSRVRSTEAPARREQSRRAPFVLLVVGLLVATTLALLLLNTSIAVNSLDATRQRAANTEQAERVDELQQQVVDGGTAAALARAAAAQGLVPAGAAAHLVLEPDGGSAVRGTAVPAPVPTPPAPED